MEITLESGHSDYQPPRSRRNPILYITKYISKETSGNTFKTFWKHYYSWYNVKSVKPKPTSESIISEQTDNITTSSVSTVQKLCKKYKVKQLSCDRDWETDFTLYHEK